MNKLGFGLMRLPKQHGRIDIEQTCQMVDVFLDAGFDYFDTAYGYEAGKSEEAAKTCIVDRHRRESFRIATKLPAWAGATTRTKAENMFYTSLKRTGAGYFDRYLLHNCGDERTEVFDRYDLWRFIEARKAEGLIRQTGFSFHDKADVLDALLTAHPEIDYVQLQINYADWESQAVQSRLCWEVACRHNKPIIIMEPIKGGTLANPPKAVRDVFLAANPNASPSEWALRFAASLAGVDMVLSGMSTLSQMQENVSFMKHMRPLSDGEQAVVAHARALLAAAPTIPCTACGYCMESCPQGVLIPKILEALNHSIRFESATGARGTYAFHTRSGGAAKQCVACGACEAVCPQHIDIVEQLQRASKLFDR